VPARLRDLVRVLAELGIRVEPPRGGGSHWKATAADGTTFPLPAHNGERTELSDVYVRKLCRAFGLDERELRERL
jgi:hypothetical protein